MNTERDQCTQNSGESPDPGESCICRVGSYLAEKGGGKELIFPGVKVILEWIPRWRKSQEKLEGESFVSFQDGRVIVNYFKSYVARGEDYLYAVSIL